MIVILTKKKKIVHNTYDSNQTRNKKRKQKGKDHEFDGFNHY